MKDNALRRAYCISAVLLNPAKPLSCVNALWRAFPISTKRYNMNIRNYGVVSMPYIGLPPFLREKSMTKIFWLSRCQCPISGFPHFYSCQITDAGGEADCVNALYRASPISTNKDSARKKINIEECQCPISGFPHFYKLDGKIGIDILRLCQCPISGFPHFYCTSGRREFEVRNCVNALYRASPISTWWILV